MAHIKLINILGSTGSIGTSALDIIGANADKYRVNLLSAGQNISLLLQQIAAHNPKYVYLHDATARQKLQSMTAALGSTKVIDDDNEYYQMLSEPHDVTISAIIGIAALKPTLNAIKGCKVLGLANKEVVICAYPFLKQALDAYKTQLIPLDSEHNAIYQIAGALNLGENQGIKDVIITASGGPFYGKNPAEFHGATANDSCAHPNWSMGAKISVDSATMMNKGLEYIEACELFGLASDRVKILIHRQSIVHGIINYIDGSSQMQFNQPDMRVHIASALDVEGRLDLGHQSFDLTSKQLTFEHLDDDIFSLPKLAREVYETGDLSMRIALNNTNEALVMQHLRGEIVFGEITKRLQDAMQAHKAVKISTLDELYNYSNEFF